MEGEIKKINKIKNSRDHELKLEKYTSRGFLLPFKKSDYG